MMTIQDSIRQRLAGAEEAKLKAKAGKKKKLQVLVLESKYSLKKKQIYY